MNRLLRSILSAGVTVLALASASVAFATPPRTINYQGVLTNPGGTPVSGAVAMTFRLYDVANGGAAVYVETQPSVNVVNGNFNAVIGATTPIPLSFDVPYWLSVAVNADPEMAPRQPLASSAYAFRARMLDGTATVDATQITGTITTATLPAGNLTGGAPGQVLAGTGGAPAFTDSPSLNGNLTLANASTAGAGNIMKGANTFMHNFGSFNTFVGEFTGNFTMTGDSNTVCGRTSLFLNTTGSSNTASGYHALSANTTGSTNTAIGTGALQSNTVDNSNTAIGQGALQGKTSGGFNIAIGSIAGGLLSTGDNNIYIGNLGAATESGTIRIGQGTQTRAFMAAIRGVTTGSANAVPVLIDSNGQLGTASSSRRFKDDIADMDEASAELMQLRPVTFHYKSDQDPSGRTLQYGLIAEEVAEVYPGLVAHSADGRIETVMYQFLPPMLLNEYQKQQRIILAQEARIADLEQKSARVEMLERELSAIKVMLGAR